MRVNSATNRLSLFTTVCSVHPSLAPAQSKEETISGPLSPHEVATRVNILCLLIAMQEWTSGGGAVSTS